MTLIHNEFMMHPESILITYDDVVKSIYPFLLDQIMKKYKDAYSSFLDFSLIEKMDMKNLERFCIQRTEKNIFDCLAKKEFDTKTALKDIKNKFVNIYDVCKLMTIGKSIPMLMNQKFTKRIYIYTEEYDVRIHIDIQKTFNNMGKVVYLSGDFGKVLETIDGVTSFILNDINYIIPIFHLNKANYTNITVANYGYNYALDDNGNLVLRLNMEEYSKDHIFKFATFSPLELTDDHFTIL